MQVSGIIKNKARVLSKVVYLDVVGSLTEKAPSMQWVLFKDKHTHQDIQAIINAEPGSSIIIDGKDNVNKQTGQSQIVIHSLLDIVPTDATLPAASSSILDDLFHSSSMESTVDTAKMTSDTWNSLNAIMRQVPKQLAIGMLAKMISHLNGTTYINGGN